MRLKIKLSDKSTAVPINWSTLRAARELLKLEIILKVKSSCDGVGVEMGGLPQAISQVAERQDPRAPQR